ncbi:MAG: glycoside hydrolase family 140 protein [Bacteroidia bacterium]|nr:glycoside hydrolase family 140 protein [Bacteroidia bacterium]
MRKVVLLFFLFALTLLASAQIKVSDNQRFLATKDGKPFFWLGDTAWELFHRLTREEADEFLEIRKQQGFNIIQAVALAEFEGLRNSNRYNDFPLVDLDPTKLDTTPGDNPSNPAEYDYWDHVDYIINKAAEKGMYIGLLPTWGDKVAHLWGDGPIIFNPENAEAYATTLATRYSKQWNIIWILGGDRPAVYKAKKDGIEIDYDDRPVWNAMAKGIENVLGKEAFITYHPWGGRLSSSQYVHEEEWLDMNSFQSSHGSREIEAWKLVTRDLELNPRKPTLDMEPCYEDHPVNPWDGKWTRQRGYFTAYDVRARIYRGVFAGACGVTYGHHHIWQFLNPDLNPPVNVGDTLIGWKKALHAEAAGQMQHLKKLMLSRPYFSRIADQSLITSELGNSYIDLAYATRDFDNSYAMIYLPQAKSISIDLSKISGNEKTVWWFNPRTGESIKQKSSKGKSVETFTPPSNGKDWVLVIDDASRNYKLP